MSAVTLNGMLNGIVAALETRFPDTEVYAEPVPGGFAGPCFFVRLRASTHAQEWNRRYRRIHSFDIQCFAADNTNVAMLEMAEQLYDFLEVVELDGQTIRSTGMRHELDDATASLHFHVDYPLLVYRPAADHPVMEALTHEGELKR